MIQKSQFLPEGQLENTTENRLALASPAALSDAMAKGQILEAPVVLCDAEHNLMVDLGCMRGKIPRKEGAIGIAEGTVRDIALISRVGKPVCFTVTEITSDRFGRPYALLSRRAAQQKYRNEFLHTLPRGHLLNARVTHLESFGAFCDIGCGVIALLPIDAISVSRIAHTKDRFSVGEDLPVLLRSIDPAGRITLTHKELLGTWEENAARFAEGQTVSGIIRSVEPYGVFVELAPNLAGLAEPRADAFAGMMASVYIKSIIPEKMKVKLIIIDCFSGDYAPKKDYFITESMITHWQYSPDCCPKKIFSDFTTTDLPRNDKPF